MRPLFLLPRSRMAWNWNAQAAGKLPAQLRGHDKSGAGRGKVAACAAKREEKSCGVQRGISRRETALGFFVFLLSRIYIAKATFCNAQKTFLSGSVSRIRPRIPGYGNNPQQKFLKESFYHVKRNRL